MMRKFYETIVPDAIKSRIYAANREDFMNEVRGQETRFEQSIPHVELSARHILNLQVLTDRMALLRAMPSGGIVAELGVWKGDFSASILSIAQPAQLYLIDPWDLLDPGEMVNADKGWHHRRARLHQRGLESNGAIWRRRSSLRIL